jgi:methionyl-tRNA synthetase
LKQLTDRQTNKYLQLNEPWAVAKMVRSLETRKVIPRTIYHSAEAIRITGILLQPYMPGKAAQLLDMIGVDESRRGFKDAVLGADETYGEGIVPVGMTAWDSLFPPLSVED